MSSFPEVRNVVIGAGNVGEKWVRDSVRQNCPTSIFETDDATAQSVVNQYHVTRARTLEEAIEKADVVYIASPIDAHFEHTLAAIEAGKIIMCEKPLTGKLHEALEIQRRVRESGVTFAVGNYYRLNSSIYEAKQAVDAGVIGKVFSIDTNYLHDMRQLNERTRWRVDSGFLYDGGVHPVDLARWIAGEEVESVYAEAGMRLDSNYPHPQDFKMVLRFPSALLASVSLNSRTILPYHGAELFIMGSEGTIRAHNKEEYFTTVKEGQTRWDLKAAPDDSLPIFRVVTIMNKIARGESDSFDPLPNIEDAVKVTRVLDAAEQSMATGSRVQVRY